VCARTGGHSDITTTSFLSFLSTCTLWHCCFPWITRCETKVCETPGTRLARKSVEARQSKAIGTKLARAVRPSLGAG
jgi:hypothetical protein